MRQRHSEDRVPNSRPPKTPPTVRWHIPTPSRSTTKRVLRQPWAHIFSAEGQIGRGAEVGVRSDGFPRQNMLLAHSRTPGFQLCCRLLHSNAHGHEIGFTHRQRREKCEGQRQAGHHDRGRLSAVWNQADPGPQGGRKLASSFSDLHRLMDQTAATGSARTDEQTQRRTCLLYTSPSPRDS